MEAIDAPPLSEMYDPAPRSSEVGDFRRRWCWKVDFGTRSNKIPKRTGFSGFCAGKRRRLRKPSEINVAEVQQFSREAAGVVMGVTADGTPIGLRVQDPDEELEMV